MADALVVDIYQGTKRFPPSERYGLQSQLRRAAVSAASNIVEGSARRTTREYVNFLNIAAGSAFEARYLVDLSSRLGFIPSPDAEPLIERYTDLGRTLLALIRSLEHEA